MSSKHGSHFNLELLHKSANKHQRYLRVSAATELAASRSYQTSIANDAVPLEYTPAARFVVVAQCDYNFCLPLTIMGLTTVVLHILVVSAGFASYFVMSLQVVPH